MENLTKKLKSIFKTDKKSSNLILLLILLVIILVSINYIFSNETSIDEKGYIPTLSEYVKSDNNIEDKLSNIISKIEGVESASVVVSFKSTEKVIPVYDTKENTDSVSEENKTSTKTTVEKTVAYEGNSAILESKETAMASGAIVVVKGNITEKTKEDIRNAVSYTTGAPIHKIQIFVN